MSDYLVGIILGAIQGLTEFIPVSSSGHLILFETLFGQRPGLGLNFDVAVHVATAFAVLYFFRKEWKLLLDSFISGGNPEGRKLLLALIIGTIPAVVLGLLLGDVIETQLRSLESVAIGLVVGSILIMAAEFLYKRRKQEDRPFTPLQALVVGIFQSIALFPGISRSGATISGGLFVGKSRYEATKFAFMLSTPVIFGAAGKQLWTTIPTFDPATLPLFVIGFISAFISGLFALSFITALMKHRTLYPFVIYRLLLAGALILFVI
ncbi:MAG: undecaprenyl-diphosphate phosphatase [bacterium]|nr:undecaprenyl-diphosphate phosphatase [bacterium]